MSRHYYIANPSSPKGFEEITESEWNELIGDEEHRNYASKLYRSQITIEDVPEDLRERVLSIVENKIAKWGEYDSQEISATELKENIEEVL